MQERTYCTTVNGTTLERQSWTDFPIPNIISQLFEPPPWSSQHSCQSQDKP